MQFSGFKSISKGIFGNKGARFQWRNPEPKSLYDVIIIGGEGHGLATAYYLAKNHGITNIAVLENGYLGGGNIADSTTIARADYLLEGNAEFYSHSLKLWNGLAQELKYNVMISDCGVLDLCHSDVQFDIFARRTNRILAEGDDAVLMNREMVRDKMPDLNFDDVRFPIYGGLYQKTAGTVRYDRVLCGYARAAEKRGIDIIQNCEVTGFQFDQGKIIGVETSRGEIKAKKIGIAVAGHSSQFANMANMRLPIERCVLQTFITEGLKPLIDTIVTFGMGHFSLFQSEKGQLVFGSNLDEYNSYAQNGNLPMLEHAMEACMAMYPALGRARVLRSWGRNLDMTMDGSPIIDKTHIEGLYLNGGWRHGGFEATPAAGWCFAHLIATDNHSEYSQKHRLDRFETGRMLAEENMSVRVHRY